MIRWAMPIEPILLSGSVASVFDGGFSGSFSLSSNGGRNGVAGLAGGAGAAIKLATTNGVAWNQTTYFMQSAFKNVGASVLHGVLDNTTAQVLLDTLANGQLRFVSNGVVRAVSAIGALPMGGAFPHVASRMKVHPSAGEVAVRVNDVPVELFNPTTLVSLGYTATGLNTRATGTTQITGIGFYSASGGVSHDFIVGDETGTLNNTWLGDKRVRYFPVNGDGARSEGAIGGSVPAATRWQGVDDPGASDEDVTCNVFSAAGQANLYTWAGVPATALGVLAVMPYARLRKDDAGVNTARVLLRTSAGVERPSADLTMTTAYIGYSGNVEEVDPVTSAAWQPGDAPQVGSTRVA